MDRRWSKTIKWSKVFRNVKSNHSIIATWSISSSRKRGSDLLQWHHWRMQEEEVWRRFAVVTRRLDIKTGKGMRSEEKIPILCGSKLFQSIPVPSSNSRKFMRKCYWSWTLRQKLIPKGFADYLYPVGNANELNSKNRSGFIPGGMSLKRGRQAVFSTTVNPMEDGNGLRETPCDLTRPRIMTYTKTWKRFQNTVFWCNLKLAHERGLQFCQTRSHAGVLYNTLPAACIEKAVCMKTTDELYQKVRLPPRVSRVLLKSNSQQDPQNQDARSCWQPSSDANSHGETCDRTVDHKIAGVTFFCSRAAEFNTREQSQDVDREVRNVFWEMGIIYCSCGRNMKSARSPTEFEQNHRDVTSILGNVIKKNRKRGVQHGASERQKMYFQAKQMRKKAQQGKHGGRPTTLSRWYDDEKFRTSLSDIGWREHHIICRQHTSYVIFLMQWTRTHCCTSHCMAEVFFARFVSSA